MKHWKNRNMALSCTVNMFVEEYLLTSLAVSFMLEAVLACCYCFLNIYLPA